MARDSERGNWGSWLEFLLSTVGCLVGLGNVWRFPYVCYTNGGAAFLIPFLLAMAVCGVPLFLLEMVVCQYSNLGPGRVWVVCPLFRGIGFGMVILTSLVSLYYNVIISWALYYLAMSFSKVLPWETCDNWWNTANCLSVMQQRALRANHTNTSFPTSDNVTINDVTTTVTSTTWSNVTVANMSSSADLQSSVEEFWVNHVLQPTDSIEDLGAIRWQLFLCLLATWVVVFFCLFKDIKTSGKVMYVLAVLPYLVLLALLIKGCTLPGADNGVWFFVVPKWHRLLDTQVWMAASAQVFYSAGIGWGGVATLASFNRFHNNCYRDAILLPVLDALTSVFSGFVIFVFLGYMAHVQNKTVDEVVTHGTGLAFIAYPEALASMPVPQLWSVLFFLVLFTVGLDSQFVHVQTITSAVADTFPRQLGMRKRWVTLAVCLLGLLLGLPFVTQGGQYVLALCDFYVASISVMLLAVAECLVLAWIYGTDRLYSDIALMIGYRPSRVWAIFWRVLSPGYVMTTWVLGIVFWKPLTGYPSWTEGFGWILSVLPLLPVPILGIATLLLPPSAGSFTQRFRRALQPSAEWKPALSGTDGEEMAGQPLKATHV